MTCGNCGESKGCWPIKDYDEYIIDWFFGLGQVSGESKMLKEIYEKGPIACPINSNEELENHRSGIF